MYSAVFRVVYMNGPKAGQLGIEHVPVGGHSVYEATERMLTMLKDNPIVVLNDGRTGLRATDQPVTVQVAAAHVM